MSMFYMTGCSI